MCKMVIFRGVTSFFVVSLLIGSASRLIATEPGQCRRFTSHLGSAALPCQCFMAVHMSPKRASYAANEVGFWNGFEDIIMLLLFFLNMLMKLD